LVYLNKRSETKLKQEQQQIPPRSAALRVRNDNEGTSNDHDDDNNDDKCGGLSTARRTMRLSVASVEMTLLFWEEGQWVGGLLARGRCVMMGAWFRGVGMRRLLLVMVVGCGSVWGQSASLLVLSKRAHTLSIVDPVSLKVVASAPVGNDPHEVVASADGKTAYVSNYGGGAYNTLAVVDLVEHKALPAVDLGALRGPHGLDFEGGKVWFTAEAAKAIGSYDPGSGKIDWILGTGQDRTHMVYVAPDLSWMVTTNVSSATVTMIEKSKRREGPPPPPPGSQGMGGMLPRPPGGGWEETVIPVGRGSEGFDVSPDGKEIWVANAQDGTVTIIDRISKKVTTTLDAKVKGANRLKFTLDGKTVLISLLSGPDLVVLDAGSRREIKRVKIGRGAAGIQMNPDGARAYVACTPDDYVAVIDLKTLEVVGHIDAGGEPDGMAWAVKK
jgi:YVTN family beta-propeller protein